MANLNEQTLRLWDEWTELTGDEAGNPDDFIDWGIQNGKLAPRPQDLRRVLRKQVTTALRQAQRVDQDGGFTYRAKQSVTLFEEGATIRRWFDTDSGGTANLRQKANHQRREAIANDVYRAVCDADHMTKAFPEEPQLTFFPDFRDDVEERRAADRLNADKDDDEDAA